MDEPLDSLSHTTQIVLRVIHESADDDSPVSTHDLTRYTGLKNDAIHYQTNQLIELGLIDEHPERVDVGAPIPAKQYIITDNGRQAVADLEAQTESIDDLDDRLPDYDRRLETQQEQINRLRERVDALEHELKF